MDKPHILHMLTPTTHLSPFDINMALDAGWDHTIAYTSVELNDVRGLVEDMIFSRGTKSIRNTGLFIAGKDVFAALEMLRMAQEPMFPPFEVSILADPSGAFTTAASMVACAQQQLKTHYGVELKDCKSMSLGGTGPVGMIVAALVSHMGGDITIISRSAKRSAGIALRCNQLMGCDIKSGDEADRNEQIEEVEVVFAAAASGVVVYGENEVKRSTKLKLAIDANAVAPAGIHGIDAKHNAVAMDLAPGALGTGALVVGDVKYHTHQRLLNQMRETKKPIVISFNDAAKVAEEFLIEKSKK